MTKAHRQQLQRLAEMHGVQTAYVDMARRRRCASPEALRGVLKALSVPASGPAEVEASLLEVKRRQLQSVLPPVVAIWDGAPQTVPIQLPQEQANENLKCCLRLENGGEHSFRCRLAQRPVNARSRGEKRNIFGKSISLPLPVPHGYHRLEVTLSAGTFRTLLIVAPAEAWTPPANRREWGAFLPLYALHANRSLGAGDFGDLAGLMQWVSKQGGNLVGTLPLLPAFLDRPFEPSPYSPVSRVMWNEFYVALDRIPEWSGCAAAQRRLRSADGCRLIRRLQAADVVDYRCEMRLKREALEALARQYFAKPVQGQASLRRFLRQNPLVEEYAAFRAAVEKQGRTWWQWPERMRAGDLRPGDYDESARRYYLYTQWQAHRQLADLTKDSRARGVRLYLDLPLGTHSDGFDVWRERESFALGASGGAPPDPVFTTGQDWGFAPLHPQGLREQEYRYFIAVLRHHLRHAGMLRIDHVMGLHRLYWVPHGLPASQGAYVRYPAEELYAILCLESHRHQAAIVGENLGTVPPEVNRDMRHRGVRGMYVVQYELQPSVRGALRPPPAQSVASLNTHDMPPFAAWWRGSDLPDRQSLGLLKPKDLPREKRFRERQKKALEQLLRRKEPGRKPMETPEALRGALKHLAKSRAEALLLNLEDLWLEDRPQNTPGTSTERVNWRRKSRLSLERMEQSTPLGGLLHEIDSLRKK